MHSEVLRSIADMLNNHGIHWALGGSSLLSYYGLAQQANDLDLLVNEAHAMRSRDLLASLGEFRELAPKEPYCTQYFYHFLIQGIGIDVMGVCGIRHAEGIYRLHWRQQDIGRTEYIEQTVIPLSTLEDWYVLYMLIPGRQHKADLIEHYLTSHGLARRDRLEAALQEPLPMEVRQRIETILSLKHS